MGAWTWEGVDRNGAKLKGKLEAKGEKDVRKVLRGRGIRVKKLIAPSILDLDIEDLLSMIGIKGKVTGKELRNFTKQLSITINAGIPILQALDILHREERNRQLRHALSGIAKAVGEGKTLAESLKAYPDIFDNLYCNLVKAGENSGKLDEILKKLAGFLESQEKIKDQVKSAMIYPAIIVIVGIIVVYIMIIFVVPGLADMLKESGQELPAVTKLVMMVSDFVRTYNIWIIIVSFASVVVLVAYAKTPPGKVMFDNIQLRLPVFGLLAIKSNLASFFRTLASMIDAGLSINDSLYICVETLNNSVIATDMKVVQKAIMEGKTFADPLSRIKYFPSLVTQMIKVGEQTGNLDDMLNKTSDIFEDEVSILIGGMMKMIEPIILVVLGGMVGVILLAMYLPIFMSAGGVTE